MTMCISDKWDLRYKDRLPLDQHACEVLQDYVHLLPDSGRALDLASGLGGNAIFLAQQGLNTVAWDISRLALVYSLKYTPHSQ